MNTQKLIATYKTDKTEYNRQVKALSIKQKFDLLVKLTAENRQLKQPRN